MATATLVALLTTTGCATLPIEPTTGSSDSTMDTPSPQASPREPSPAGLLVEVRAASHPGYDRLVFEFGGDKPPAHRIQTVDEVRQDPTDKLIPLRGKRFHVVVFDGAVLDTAQWESDPAKARRYLGPDRLTPDLPLLKEVAIAGNFEAVLSFGVGLAGPAKMDIQELSSPARLVIDFRGQ